MPHQGDREEGRPHDGGSDRYWRRQLFLAYVRFAVDVVMEILRDHIPWWPWRRL
jgi:hypothetical protein